MKYRLLIESDFESYEGLEDDDKFDGGSIIEIGNGYDLTVYANGDVVVSKDDIHEPLGHVVDSPRFEPYLDGFCKSLMPMCIHNRHITNGLARHAEYAIMSAVDSIVATEI